MLAGDDVRRILALRSVAVHVRSGDGVVPALREVHVLHDRVGRARRVGVRGAPADRHRLEVGGALGSDTEVAPPSGQRSRRAAIQLGPIPHRLVIAAAAELGVNLGVPLGLGQRIYPWSNGVGGVTVTAEAYVIYLPLVARQYEGHAWRNPPSGSHLSSQPPSFVREGRKSGY